MIKEKKKLTHTDDEVKRCVGALTEHYTDGQKVVAEQYIGLREHLDKRFERIDEKFERIDEKIDGIKTTQDSHTEMIGKIMIQLEEVKGELKQKVSYQDFTKLELRVTRLETSTATRH